jgi:hypothetical protein
MIPPIDDVETRLGRALCDDELMLVESAAPGLRSMLSAIIGPLERITETLAIRVTQCVAEVRVASPLHEVSLVTVDGDEVDVWWSADGRVRLPRNIEPGSLVELTVDHGHDPLPADIVADMAGRLAALVRSSSISRNLTRSAGVASQTIGATTVAYHAASSDAMTLATDAGANFLRLTRDEERALRRRFGILPAGTVRH